MDLVTQFKAIAAGLCDRYLPVLHVLGEIDRTVEQHLRTATVRHGYLDRLNQVSRATKDVLTEIARLERLPDNGRFAELAPTVGAVVVF